MNQMHRNQIALGILAAAFIVGCARVARGPAAKNSDDLPHVVKFEKGAKKLVEAGDDIEITEVRGTSQKIEAGNIYLVKGNVQARIAR